MTMYHPVRLFSAPTLGELLMRSLRHHDRRHGEAAVLMFIFMVNLAENLPN